MQENIGGGFEDGAVFEESEGFEAKRRISGEAAEHADEKKDADIGA